MKILKLILFAAILFFNKITFSQEYFYVIRSVGNITANNKPINPKDKIYESDTIKFSSVHDKLYVLHSIKGSIELTPEKNSNLEHKLVAFLKNKYLPERTTTSSRNHELLQNTEDFQLYFKNIGYLLLPNNKFFVDTVIYPLSNNSFFFIRYKYQGEDVNKKLPNWGNSVLLQTNNLFSLDGHPIPHSEGTDFRLYYYKALEKKSFILCNMDLKVANETDLKNEIKFILDAVIDSKKNNEFIFQYLNLAYGNFDENAIQKIIKTQN